MNVSVAMTTYNGEKFVENQLKSILNQTMIPNEIVIVDDCSSDATKCILQRIVKENSHIDWKIIFNEENIGWKSNFARAIRNTTGDIVFLADQDDVWFENKIEIMLNQFVINSEMLVLASKYETVLWKESDMLSSVLRGQGSGRSEKVMFDEFFYMSHFPGCSMAFRGMCRKWFESPLWSNKQPHDEFLWTMAKIFEGAFFYTEKTMLYIRHTNAATIDKGHNLRSRIQQLKEKLVCIHTVRNVLLREQNILDYNNKIKLMHRASSFVKQRLCFLEKPSVTTFWGLIKQMRMYEQLSFFVGDIICALLKKN